MLDFAIVLSSFNKTDEKSSCENTTFENVMKSMKIYAFFDSFIFEVFEIIWSFFSGICDLKIGYYLLLE